MATLTHLDVTNGMLDIKVTKTQELLKEHVLVLATPNLLTTIISVIIIKLSSMVHNKTIPTDIHLLRLPNGFSQQSKSIQLQLRLQLPQSPPSISVQMDSIPPLESKDAFTHAQTAYPN